jgi:hypothetical protein
MGVHAVITLCKRSVGAAVARADRPPVWDFTLPLVSCPRTRYPRPSRAGGAAHGGALRSVCDHGVEGTGRDSCCVNQLKSGLAPLNRQETASTSNGNVGRPRMRHV